MIGLNKIMLIGTVGRNPETRYIGQGVSFSKFSVATTCMATGAGGRPVEETEWHEAVVFRGLSDYVARYLKKGDTVYVEGKLKSRYVSDGPGSGHRIYEVHASAVNILARSKANQESPMPDSGEHQQPQQNIGGAIPGFDIEHAQQDLAGDGDSMPF